jgi:ribokinase
VLGSITLDAVFRMPRFPAPGETLFANSAALFPGGKGLNQAIAAARLGASASLIGCVGQDAFADILLAAAAADGVDAAHVSRGAGQTGLAIPIVVPGGENAILAAPGANLELTVYAIDEAAALIAASDALLVQFESPFPAIARALSIARRAGTRTILNPAPVQAFDHELLGLVDVLIVNEVEAASLVPADVPPSERARALTRLGPGVAVVTLGPAGGAWAAGADAGTFAPFPAEAVDTVGAGDCFCGALAVALCEGLALPAALRFAAAAAAVSVTRAGAAPSLPFRPEVMALFGG